MIVPHDITEQVLEVLADRHVELLAELERDKGLAPKVLPHLNLGHLVGEGFRYKHDKPPIALVGTFGTVEPPARSPQGLDFTWTVAVEVTTVGVDAGDTVKRRDWYGFVALQTIMMYVPRMGGPIDYLAIADVDLTPGVEPETGETVATTRLLFDVGVKQTLSLNPPFPAKPADPYEVPPGRPVATKTNVNVTQEVATP